MFADMATTDLDDLSGIPRYIQIATVVEREIRDGTWAVGSPIESALTLAQRFGVARETARKAHTLLKERGYLASVPGVGMVVTPAHRWPSEHA